MGEFIRHSSVATRRPLCVRCEPYGESLKMKIVIPPSYTPFAAYVARFSPRWLRLFSAAYTAQFYTDEGWQPNC